MEKISQVLKAFVEVFRKMSGRVKRSEIWNVSHSSWVNTTQRRWMFWIVIKNFYQDLDSKRFYMFSMISHNGIANFYMSQVIKFLKIRQWEVTPIRHPNIISLKAPTRLSESSNRRWLDILNLNAYLLYSREVYWTLTHYN